MPIDTTTVLTVAKVLSALTMVVFFAVLVNVRRRPSFPALSYGELTLSQGRLRWVWFGLLVGALGLGAVADPIVRSTRDFEDPEARESASTGTLTQTGVTVPLPFYRYERRSVSIDGRLAEESTLEGVVLPFPLLWAFAAYWLLVVRWNPENRWARRVLEGWRSR